MKYASFIALLVLLSGTHGALWRSQITQKHLHDKPGGRPFEPELQTKLQQFSGGAAGRGQLRRVA